MIQYTPKKIGWLLACNAPENIAKGERLLAELDEDQRQVAEAYARRCVTLYLADGAENMRLAYVGHRYVTDTYVSGDDVDLDDATAEQYRKDRAASDAPECLDAADLIAALLLAEATIVRLDKHGSAVGTLDVIRAALAKAVAG